MNNPQVSIINAADSLSDETVEHLVAALQEQFHQDVAQYWGDMSFGFVPRGEPPFGEQSWIVLVDDAIQADYLGWHDTTTAGLPMSKVFVQACERFGIPLLTTVGHEAIEMRADPDAEQTVVGPDGATLYALEPGDPVESGMYKNRDGDWLTNFALPSWFDPRGTAPFDFMGLCKESFEVLPDCHQMIFQHNRWSSLLVRAVMSRILPREVPEVGSRRERRWRKAAGIPWQRSTVGAR